MELKRLPYVFLGILSVALAEVELNDFYPYGRREGDTSLPENDDSSSGLVNIAFTFPFFDRDHNALYVNTNGAVSFLVEISQYTPNAFPLGDNRRLIAPFWADVDTTGGGGEVFYRETKDRVILTRVTNEIRSVFVKQRRFTAKWAMVVTWLNVAHFGGSSLEKNNTFQLVMASNGVNSFVLFHYNRIEWIYGALSRSTAAQAGFNAGDGIRYYNIPNSRTPAIINITSTSNIGVPGKWIFQVDGEKVERGGCSFRGGKLVLSPRSGIELGGTEVYIGGPCYSQNDQIICRFNRTIQTPGVYVNPEQAFCVTPPLYVVGRIPVEMSLNNGETFNYTGSFTSIPLGRNPPDVQGLDIKQWVDATTAKLTWDHTVLNTSNVDIEIFVFDSVNIRLSEQSYITYNHLPNTGSFTLNLHHDTNDSPNIRKRITNSDDESAIGIVRITPSTSMEKRAFGFATRVLLFSLPYISRWVIPSNTKCLTWYLTDLLLTDVQKIQEELLPCPTSLQAAFAERGTFRPDDGAGAFVNSFFHPGAQQCFRSETPSSSGAGQQCCYDNAGRLIVGPPGGGTLDKVSPAQSTLKHFFADVRPWFICCKLANECDKYYDRRPSDDGSRYEPPPIAATNGDPHLVTFDGTSYTFNGHGEYLLLSIFEPINLAFQGRMEPIIDSQGRETKATALTALVVSETGSDTVQVKLNPRRVMDVFINGDPVEFDEQIRLDFTGVFVIRQNRSKLNVFLNSGVSINIKAFDELLTYEITIPVQFKGKTAGLLGYWDDSKEKEFLLPNGTFLDTNSSSRVLHYQFGQKWIVSKNSSLFAYGIGESYEDFVDLVFIPIFLSDNVPSFPSYTLKQEAKNICGDNNECMFDIAVSGKTIIGQATLNSINELKERVKNSQITADPVYFGCDGVQNSGKTLDACGICGGNNSTCTDCDGVVRPNVLNNGKCNKKNMLKFFLLVIGIPAGSLLICSVFIVACYFSKRKKSSVDSTSRHTKTSHVNSAYDAHR